MAEKWGETKFCNKKDKSNYKWSRREGNAENLQEERELPLRPLLVMAFPAKWFGLKLLF